MKRRTACAAMFAIAGQILADDAKVKAQNSMTTGNLAVFKPPEELRIALSGDGYKRFVFTHGDDRVTITADELFAALKG